MVQIIVKDRQLDQYFDVNFKELIEMQPGTRFSLNNESFMLEFEKQEPFKLVVTNGVNGYGENCAADFAESEVEIKSNKHYQSGIWDEISKERDFQDKKFGIRDMPENVWLPILGEEVGEVNKAVVEKIFNVPNGDNYREELIQVAAVAVAMIESYDRQKQNN